MNQKSVICQFVWEKDQSGICREMHGGGCGVCSLVFQLGAGFYTLVGPCIVIIVILAHAIARVLKTEKILVGRGATF